MASNTGLQNHMRADGAVLSDLLLTDLYEFTMLQAYAGAGLDGTAVFEFFVRKLPETRGFLIAAGLEQVVEFLEGARFSEDDLDVLRACSGLDPDFIESLRGFRFTGDVDAMPEGTVFFADEPILRVVAPLPEAQLVETKIINLLHFQTVVASKAARMVLAAGDRPLVDFGLRRAHGADAGLLAARASYLAGFAGSATTPAAARFGVPVFGTMAHSFVQVHACEDDAFINFARARPEGTTLLIDTYDTEAAARKVVALGPRLKQMGVHLGGVRIDSGDLAAHAREVREILDRGGLEDVKIVASGGLNETKLQAYTDADVPIDSYGVGTSLTTSQDAPALDCAYKLQEYDGEPRRKRSEGKATWPGRKQVFRQLDATGAMERDTLCLDSETFPGTPLLAPAMRGGRRVASLPSLEEARRRATGQLSQLPEPLHRLERAPPFDVVVSDRLRQLAQRADDAVRSDAETAAQCL